jgi:hypothetical protein
MSESSSAYVIRKLRERQDGDRGALKKAAMRAATDLEKACSALNAFLLASIRAGHPDDRGAADSRRQLMASMSEYADWLARVYGRD